VFLSSRTVRHNTMFYQQAKTYHSSVPFFSDMMISPLISLLKGQHFQNAFIVAIRPKHLCMKHCHVNTEHTVRVAGLKGLFFKNKLTWHLAPSKL
jgi:hypothetical protein